MALSSEFVSLVQQEIPEGRQSLSDSHANLEKVAAYCIENFARTDNKKAALEETKNYTTQSLASVAYQINTLAYNFLQMIEQQTNQLAEMESQVNYINQMVMVHKEKVARREIGVLTNSKTTARQYKILAPANGEKPIKYIRKPIDFNKLDDIGHGMRSLSSTAPRTRRSSSSVSSSQPMPPNPVQHQPPPSAGPAPTTKPPTPPQASRSVSSLSRGSREYRTPPAVAPPQVPSNYAPNYPIGHPRRNERGGGYSTLPMPSAAHSAQSVTQAPPQVGMVQPMMNQTGHYATQASLIQQQQQQQQQQQYQQHQYLPHEAPQYASNQGMSNMPHYCCAMSHQPYFNYPPPSPATSNMISEPDYNRSSSGTASPPLPPPPLQEAEDAVPGVPANYLEKVIAVYDYQADKDDELSFSENAVIYVLKKNDDGWWEGVFKGTTGLFPGNYVEPLM